MSALTDLFTSLANKIRSKLGTTSTYTPAQAIAAIDNVYNKGVTDTKKGDAATSDVKSGKTFTSTNGVDLTGTFAAQTKSASPSTSAQTISPDSGKYLSSVSISAISPQRSPGVAAYATGRNSTGPYVYVPYGWYNPESSSTQANYAYLTEAQGVAVARKQEKTITASRSAQTVTPDSNYLLSEVTVNKYPDATGTFTTSSNSSAVDMGATNNYRYVNTTGVYNAGKLSTATKEITLMAPPAGSWCLVLMPFTCGTFKINNRVYQSGSYVSGDIMYFRNSAGSNLSSLDLNTAASGVTQTFSGNNLYAIQIVLAAGSGNRIVYMQYTCS